MYELTISLRPKSGTPLYEQIYDHIKGEIQDGHIKSGEKLPSTRALCRHLEVSRSTVELAYEQLLSEGYVEAEPCRGYFVSQIEGLYHFERQERKRPEGKQEPEKSYLYDFTPNGVDLKSFPYNAWRKLSRECLTDDRAELFRLGNPQGEYGLRNAICSYLHQARGVNCRPEQVIVGAGSDYLLMLLIMIIGSRHRVALENPTYRQAYRIFENLSCEVCTVDMDSRGMQVDRLRESGADIAFVMPSHQYPLGIVMPIRRRMELLKWADEEPGRYIIEDDYDSEFRYKGQPIPALAGFDQKGCVIYLGTFSKSLAPSVRVSYMVLPPVLMKAYLSLGHLFSVTVSRTDQKILELFLREGYYERHLNRMRAVYKNKHDLMVRYLKEMSHICTFSGENAGVHLVVRFCNGLTEKEGIRRAKEAGIKVYGVSEYRIRQVEKEENRVLLGYATMEEKDIEEAMKKLKEIWKI